MDDLKVFGTDSFHIVSFSSQSRPDRQIAIESLYAPDWATERPVITLNAEIAFDDGHEVMLNDLMETNPNGVLYHVWIRDFSKRPMILP